MPQPKTPKIPIRNELEHLIKPAEPVKAPVPVKKKRTLGDVYTALEAQRIFNPAIPSIAKPPMPAPANQQNIGTAPAMDMTGGWGSQGEKYSTGVPKGGGV